MEYNNNDNSILIDVSSSKRNNKNKPIFCVLCNNEKIQLVCVNPEENRYKCPRCKNTYQPNFEIMPQEDILESSHEENDEGPVLIYAEDNNMQVESVLNDNKPKSDIKIPKYMQDSETSKVEYHEY